MITLAKLKVFRSYKGDGDMFARSSRKKDRETMNEADWNMIDILLQDATVLNRKLGSESRTEQAWRRLRENCENEVVVEEILRIAESGI